MKNIIPIWAPKYMTNEVLVATHKVKAGKNYIKFTKAAHLTDGLYWADSKDIRKCRMQPNGKGKVYCVPFKLFTHKSAQAPLFDDTTLVTV